MPEGADFKLHISIVLETTELEDKHSVTIHEGGNMRPTTSLVSLRQHRHLRWDALRFDVVIGCGVFGTLLLDRSIRH